MNPGGPVSDQVSRTIVLGIKINIKQKKKKGGGGFPGGSVGKEFTCNVGDSGSILGLGRSSGRGNGNPLQYSCLENPMDKRAWWATVHGVTELDTTKATEHPKANEYV